MNAILKEDIDRFKQLLETAETLLANQQTYLVKHKNPLIKAYLQVEKVIKDLEAAQ